MRMFFETPHPEDTTISRVAEAVQSIESHNMA